MIVKESQEEEDYDSANEIDNEEEGGEWVTPDNIHKFVGGGETAVIPKKVEEDVVKSV